jgi:lysozyme family protein
VPPEWAPVFQWTLRVERGPTDGRVDDPDDRGGRTKDGITQATFDAWNVTHGRPKRDVWDIADEETAEIYFHDFWLRGRCDLIADRTDRPDRVVAPKLALVHYDACVNHGIHGVSKSTGRVFGANAMLQEVIGVQPFDGWLGKETFAALDRRLGVGALTLPPVWRSNEATLVQAYLARRQRLYESLARQPGQKKYLAGWLARLRCLRVVAASFT